MNDIFIPDGEADPPTRHVVALGKREELNANLLRAGDLQKTRGSIAVEGQIGVSQIMDHDKIVLFGKLDDALEKIQFDNFSGRIMRETDDQHFRLGPGLLDRFFQVTEKILARNQRNAAQVA